jgi:serine phosphatase RsbU (regulator of sigma subunit)
MDNDRRIAELTTLNKISSALNQAPDLQSALQSSLEELVQLMGLTTGWVFLEEDFVSGAGTGLVPAAYFQLPAGLAANGAARLKPPGCACQELFERGRLQAAVNIVRCSRINTALEDGEFVGGLRIHASVPIRTLDRTIGIINLASPENHRFSDDDLQLMTVVGDQIGLAAERAHLFDLTRAQRVEEQAALLKLSNSLLSLSDLQPVIDQVVEVVADVLDADACALVLADEHDQIEFRGAVGWDLAMLEGVSGTFVRQAPAGLAYHTGQPVVVADLAADEHLEHPSLASDAGFRSALAVPVSHSSRKMGALIVHDRSPGHFREEDVRLLQLMANQAAIAIEQARLRERAVAEERLRRELELARQIQSSFLPQQVPSVSGWEFGVYYAPARQVGGDFYDFIPLHDSDVSSGAQHSPPTSAGGRPGGPPSGPTDPLFGLTIADVSDKGVPAALFMALSRTFMRAVAVRGRQPADVVRRVNRLIVEENPTSQFVTLFYGVLDPEAATLCFVNAGHNPPLLYRSVTGEVQILEPSGIALGVIEPVDPVETETTLDPGDVLLLYTDGLTEAVNDDDEEFGLERLQAVLRDVAEQSASAQVTAVVEAASKFAASPEPFDDVTLVAVVRTG